MSFRSPERGTKKTGGFRTQLQPQSYKGAPGRQVVEDACGFKVASNGSSEWNGGGRVDG